jgi:hypothetical protein
LVIPLKNSKYSSVGKVIWFRHMKNLQWRTPRTMIGDVFPEAAYV